MRILSQALSHIISDLTVTSTYIQPLSHLDKSENQRWWTNSDLTEHPHDKEQNGSNGRVLL